MNSYYECMRVLEVVERFIDDYNDYNKQNLGKLADGLTGCQQAVKVKQDLDALIKKVSKAHAMVAEDKTMVRG